MQLFNDKVFIFSPVFISITISLPFISWLCNLHEDASHVGVYRARPAISYLCTPLSF